MKAAPAFLFAPGAGASSTSAWMVGWRDRLRTLGDVVTLDYPYMLAGRKYPDRLPALIEAHRQALAALRARAGGPVFLAGKSMGGRVGCHLALEEAVAGVICFGFPLRAASSGALRDQVLVDLRTPLLLLQGSRDPLCPLEDLAAVRARMSAPHTVLIVEGGDHSLALSAAHRKAAGVTQADADARVLDAIRRFVAPT
ncbi:MAG TPA: alpha/beta family hydrolase [Polyangia bacterium]|nr:alpha/beta family hydrolase [Polyangia bacterium]